MENTGANLHERCRGSKEALELNEDHPIQTVSRFWRGERLSQSQWDEMIPEILACAMLDECEDSWTWDWIGPHEREFKTQEEAKQALSTKVEMKDRDMHNSDLPTDEKNHIAAVQWMLELCEAGSTQNEDDTTLHSEEWASGQMDGEWQAHG